MMPKPQYIVELEQHTGLECVLIPETENRCMPEYNVLSPTSVVLFKVGGTDEHTIGMVSTPEMYDLQGISPQIRHARRKRNWRQ
jgi:hypothetical protein